jgi:hypothetical protein
MIKLLYKRQNMTEEVIADVFGISQGTVSSIITEFSAADRSGHRGVPAGPSDPWSLASVGLCQVFTRLC